MQFAEPDLLEPGLQAPLAALRAATRDHHLRLDRLLDLRRFGETARYAAVLRVLDGFLPAWECAAHGLRPDTGAAYFRACATFGDLSALLEDSLA